MGAVLGCQPVSSRLISIRLRAVPFNITIIQVYAPTSGHDNSEVDHFYQQLQETIDKTPKKDILVVQGDWNAKVGKDAQADWGEVCGPYCNVETNERGLRLLEFATFNNLVLTNTLGPHKPSRRWTWHSPDGKHHNQIDYILVKKRFRSGVNIHRTRSFPGADIGSDHDLVMMTFQVRLKKTRKPNQPRLRFDLEKLRDPDVACTFQATIGGKSRKETPQKLTQLSLRSHPRHLVGKRTAQKDITIDTTSDSQVNSNFPYRWSLASLTFSNYFYLFLYLYIT